MLIDQVGYLDDAIAFIESMSNTVDSHVVEYKEPFTFKDLMGVQSKSNLLNLDRSTLHDMCTPEIMYLWRAF